MCTGYATDSGHKDTNQTPLTTPTLALHTQKHIHTHVFTHTSVSSGISSAQTLSVSVCWLAPVRNCRVPLVGNTSPLTSPPAEQGVWERNQYVSLRISCFAPAQMYGSKQDSLTASYTCCPPNLHHTRQSTLPLNDEGHRSAP